MMTEYTLEMRDICKSFFGVPVLRNAHLEIKPGEVHVLMGENGAGKSTLIKILSADYRKDSGTVILDGKEMNFRSTQEAIENGISVIYQELHLNPHVPVYENMFLNREEMRGPLLDKAKMIKKAGEYLEAAGIVIAPRTLVSDLSIAQRQMVEIAKAFSLNARVMVLDEPTAAITDKDTERLFMLIRELKAQGVSIVYISHRMQEIFEIGDRCTVMRNGETIGTVEIKNSSVDELTSMMIGKSVQFKKESNSYIKLEEASLKVEGLYYKDFLKDISFTLHKGEILGFAGLVGSGRTETAKCIIGDYARSKGKITVKNDTVELRPKKIKDSLSNGVVYLSEDRKDEGLIVEHSIAENVVLPSLKRFGKNLVSTKMINRYVQDSVKKLNVRTNSIFQEAQTLSGGNQQKVVIAKWLSTEADVYIFDEPTRGIDVGARSEIYDIIMDLAKYGASIIIISSDIVELLKLSDRILIMYDGRIVTSLENDGSLTQQDVTRCVVNG